VFPLCAAATEFLVSSASAATQVLLVQELTLWFSRLLYQLNKPLLPLLPNLSCFFNVISQLPVQVILELLYQSQPQHCLVFLHNLRLTNQVTSTSL
jgi:hypothetical protein